MKSRDILTDISIRSATAQPIEPSFTALSYEGGDTDFEALTCSLHEEFPFLSVNMEEIDDGDIAQFDGLFAWLVDQLRNFPNGAPDPERHLVYILVLAMMLESDHELWEEIAKAVPKLPTTLIDEIAKVFVNARPDNRKLLKQVHSNPNQISTVLDDIAKKDWESVEWTMIHLWGWAWLPLKSHAAAALYQYDRTRLEILIECTGDFFEISTYVLHAPSEQTLTLAKASKNWTFKFWALHKSAKDAAAGKQSYPHEWEALLNQAAGEPEEWARWLAVLNKYPSRYPQLQHAIGSALVGASDEALDVYVASISRDGDFARPQLAAALSVFRSKAPLPIRQRLWTAAFRQWGTWDFGCCEESRSLFQVARSSFDYPVMGYLTECLTTKARADMAAKLQMRAVELERAWHTDVTPAISERFKLISTYQLLAHAEAVMIGESEWLAGDALYRPPWEDGTAYRSLKYDLDMGKPTF